MEYFNKWYAVMQWDAMDKQYVELVKRPHKHLCYEYIQKSNLRNTKVVAYYWQEIVMNNCPACEEVAEMKRYGWDDYFCRKHDEPIYSWIK